MAVRSTTEATEKSADTVGVTVLRALGVLRGSTALRRAAIVATAVATVACGDPPSAPTDDADVARWQTWVLPDAAALRPGPPPTGDAARAELEEVVARQRARTASTDSLVRRWDTLPGEPWTAEALALLQFYWYLLPDVRLATPARSARAMALLHVAVYDALVAAYEAKGAYPRRAPPAEQDGRVRALVAPRAGESTWPSEHAAAAAAAAAVLSYLFPQDDTLAFHRRAREAGESRVVAGVAFPSDVAAGEAIGRAVGARVLAWARADGADAPWTGSVPTGALSWRPTPPRMVSVPFDAGAGGWRTWVIASGSAYRPVPPPARDAGTFVDDLAELRRLGDGARTAAQADAARRWATDAPSAAWETLLGEEIAARRLSPLRAARARALVSVAMYDAFVACWDAKFTYWLARPVTVDPTLRTVFSTPPFPSYPSGHSTISTAAAEVMAALFPDGARRYEEEAREASFSRVWAGVHYRFDVVAGDALGARVGRAVVARMGRDGAAR